MSEFLGILGYILYHFVSDLWGGDLIHVRSMIGYQKSLTSSDWGPTNHGTPVLRMQTNWPEQRRGTEKPVTNATWNFSGRLEMLTISHNQNTSKCDEARIEDLEQQVKNLRAVRDAVLLRLGKEVGRGNEAYNAVWLRLYRVASQHRPR